MSTLRRFLPLLIALLALTLPLAGCGAGGLVEDLAGGAGGGTTPPPPGGGSSAMSPGEKAYADEVLRLVNVERASRGLSALAYDDGAERTAYGHSLDMDARNFFDHYDPDGNGPGQRLAANGVTGFSGWGENIAMGYETPAIVVNAWMGSPGHRDNILRSGFTHLGVGVHSAGSIWWTQVFLTR